MQLFEREDLHTCSNHGLMGLAVEDAALGIVHFCSLFTAAGAGSRSRHLTGKAHAIVQGRKLSWHRTGSICEAWIGDPCTTSCLFFLQPYRRGRRSETFPPCSCVCEETLQQMTFKQKICQTHGIVSDGIDCCKHIRGGKRALKHTTGAQMTRYSDFGRVQ